jgi:glycerol-3-phosphate dehydrogenase
MGVEAGVEMHICDAVAQVVEHDVPLPDVVRDLMSRPPGFEFESAHEFEL